MKFNTWRTGILLGAFIAIGWALVSLHRQSNDRAYIDGRCESRCAEFRTIAAVRDEEASAWVCVCTNGSILLDAPSGTEVRSLR